MAGPRNGRQRGNTLEAATIKPPVKRARRPTAKATKLLPPPPSKASKKSKKRANKNVDDLETLAVSPIISSDKVLNTQSVVDLDSKDDIDKALKDMLDTYTPIDYKPKKAVYY